MGTRLAHNTEIVSAPGTSGGLIRDFIRPAVRAIPFGIAERVGLRRVSLAPGDEESGVASRWTAAEGRLDISIATLGRRHHDIAMELLVCVGQALWEELHEAERRAWWLLLDVEIQSDFKGEIDEQALREKSALLRGRVSARSSRRLERYGQAAFAGTVAEYIHSLWHDVHVRKGPDYLPAPCVERRLRLISRWYPPNRGYRLFGRRL